MCTRCMPGAHGNQKRGVKSSGVVDSGSHHVSAGS